MYFHVLSVWESDWFAWAAFKKVRSQLSMGHNLETPTVTGLVDRRTWNHMKPVLSPLQASPLMGSRWVISTNHCRPPTPAGPRRSTVHRLSSLSACQRASSKPGIRIPSGAESLTETLTKNKLVSQRNCFWCCLFVLNVYPTRRISICWAVGHCIPFLIRMNTQCLDDWLWSTLCETMYGDKCNTYGLRKLQ